MRMLSWIVGWVLMAASTMAGDIVVSIESNGVLRAEGMEPGTICDVEWAQDLQNSFRTNNPSFRGLTVDSNGVVEVAIPMFFRVIGIPAVPQGMVAIPGGTNSGTDPDFGAYSLTVEGFYMDTTEVTKAQWDTVYIWAITNGYSFDNAGLGKGPDHPVHTVHWYDCVKWCNARSEKEGRTPCYTVGDSTYKTGQSEPDCNFDANGYRLPTSDEWEYAARGGLSGKRFPWGDTINHNYANYNANGSAYSYDTSPYTTNTYHPSYDDGGDPYTSPAGSFAANEYGLYDMSGNVREWCNDSVGSLRILLGGSWNTRASFARCVLAYSYFPSSADTASGLRAVCR